MDKKVTGIVAYFTWIGLLIAFLAGDKEGAKLHLNRALVIWIAEVVVVVVRFVPFIGGIASTVLNIALLVFWILGLVAAIKEDEKELPIIDAIKIIK